MEVLERLLAAKATVEAENKYGRGAPELGTWPEGCGDCADRIQSDSFRVTRVGRVDDRRKEQVSKIIEPREREREEQHGSTWASRILKVKHVIMMPRLQSERSYTKKLN